MPRQHGPYCMAKAGIYPYRHIGIKVQIPLYFQVLWKRAHACHAKFKNTGIAVTIDKGAEYKFSGASATPERKGLSYTGIIPV